MGVYGKKDNISLKNKQCEGCLLGLSDDVCDKYDNYFRFKIRDHKSDFYKEVMRISELSKHSNVALLCWCYPKRYHAESIVKYIKELRNEDQDNN